MSIRVTKPGNVHEGAVEIRVRGDCGHEWVARTTKAAMIQANVMEQQPGQQRRVRLTCPDCYRRLPVAERRSGRGGNLVPVVAIQDKRLCQSPGCVGGPTILSIYNAGEICGPCTHRQLMRAAAKTITTEDRLLGYLFRRDRSAEWLANVLRLGLVPTRRMLADLIDRGLVDFGEPGRTNTHRHRTTYKLVVSPDEVAG